MSKFKFLVSFAFVLCLVLAMGTCAFAVDITADQDEIPADSNSYDINLGVTVTTNNGSVDYNHGIVTTNNNIVASNYNTVGTNNGIVVNNSGTIVENRNIVELNEYGNIERNYKTVNVNKGYITNNYGVVNENTPPTDDHHVGILNNFGSVTNKNNYTYPGQVVKNFGGTVVNEQVHYNYFKLTSNIHTADELLGIIYNSETLHPTSGTIMFDGESVMVEYLEIHADSSGENFLFVLDDDRSTVRFPMPANYTLMPTGDCIVQIDNNEFTISNIRSDIRLEFTAVNPGVPAEPGMQEPEVSNPYSVPATGDMSNMPLWGALFISFAALAMLTRKKKA